MKKDFCQESVFIELRSIPGEQASIETLESWVQVCAASGPGDLKVFTMCSSLSNLSDMRGQVTVVTPPW